MTTDQPGAGQDGFRDWIERMVRPKALGRMIRPQTFDSAMATAEFLPDVIERQQNQKEFLLPIWEYLEIAVSEERVRNGRAAVRKWRELFNRVEQRFGVEPEVVAAIWGLETGYGVVRGSYPTLSALATLAWRGSRSAFFEDELIAALRIVQAGNVKAERMLGSWAGAMGHGQFIPSSFLDFAVDFDGDNRRDIWSDDPTDAIGSIANYLAKHGWRRGQPWGYEVRLAEGFDYSMIGLDQAHPTSVWEDAGVQSTVAQGLPDYGVGSILLPAGHRGAAFMALRNTHALLRYNNSEFYALGIGLLADRIGGGKGLAGTWPMAERVLDRNEVQEVQSLLTDHGFPTQGIDGFRGPNTTRAARAYQMAEGLVADGNLSVELLEALRQRAG
ncbi:lytic murein transglycosylase [Maritimibacter sp. UBA3975]|uniref:lytic murein transglycosylase n=1 Tax=Maritimibacter sp. UBA3975 TaxID=1946833 RepID=UPI000C0BB073|nr:lytic murein transglycosylase [Maritimibacter sp. UBA3975]MAM63534.1 murein transglycosylase [Maritimibacter sp.]|tara:strand:+ start:73831 stop:74991 length:1161 start_codon:yes stop_codon:yes gene_type:complete